MKVLESMVDCYIESIGRLRTVIGGRVLLNIKTLLVKIREWRKCSQPYVLNHFADDNIMNVSKLNEHAVCPAKRMSCCHLYTKVFGYGQFFYENKNFEIYVCVHAVHNRENFYQIRLGM